MTDPVSKLDVGGSNDAEKEGGADANPEPPAVEGAAEERPKIKLGKKRKYALFLGYLGVGYHVSAAPGARAGHRLASRPCSHAYTSALPRPPPPVRLAGHAAQPPTPHHRVRAGAGAGKSRCHQELQGGHLQKGALPLWPPAPTIRRPHNDHRRSLQPLPRCITPPDPARRRSTGCAPHAPTRACPPSARWSARSWCWTTRQAPWGASTRRCPTRWGHARPRPPGKGRLAQPQHGSQQGSQRSQPAFWAAPTHAGPRGAMAMSQQSSRCRGASSALRT